MTLQELNTLPLGTPLHYASPDCCVIAGEVRESEYVGRQVAAIPRVHRGVKQWQPVPVRHCYLSPADARAALRDRLLQQLAELEAHA